MRWLWAAIVAACASGGEFPGDEGMGGEQDPGTDAASGFPDAWTPDAFVPVPGEDAVSPSPPDASPPDAAPCVGGSVNMVDPATGHCYMRFDNGRRWDDAQANCVAFGAHLVTVGDQAESDFLRGLLGSRTSWLGANDRDAEGSWRWVTGEPWVFTYWEGDQPDNGSGSEDCAEMRNSSGRWNDDQCGGDKDYVCER